MQAVLLLGDEHKKLWDITLNVLKGIVPEDQFPATEGRIKGFAGGHGTVLFFEDENVVKDLQSKFALYADRFPQWSQHASVRLHPLPLPSFPSSPPFCVHMPKHTS